MACSMVGFILATVLMARNEIALGITGMVISLISAGIWYAVLA